MRFRLAVMLALVLSSVVTAACARLPKAVSPPAVSLDEVTHPDPGARAYLTSVHQRIKARWTHPCARDGFFARCTYPEGLVIVDVGIATNGDVSSLNVVKSSGVAVLDAGALDAVKAAAPFEAVPAALVRGTSTPVRLRMRYTHAASPLWR